MPPGKTFRTQNSAEHLMKLGFWVVGSGLIEQELQILGVDFDQLAHQDADSRAGLFCQVSEQSFVPVVDRSREQMGGHFGPSIELVGNYNSD